MSLLYTKEPLDTGHFCGKWPIKIRIPMSLRHPVWHERRSKLHVECRLFYRSLFQKRPINGVCSLRHPVWHERLRVHVWLMSHLFSQLHVECRLFCRSLFQKRPINGVCSTVWVHVWLMGHTCTSVTSKSYSYPPCTPYSTHCQKRHTKQTIFCKRDL